MKKREKKNIYLLCGITSSVILMACLMFGLMQGKTVKAACDTHTGYITEQKDISEFRNNKDSDNYYISVPTSTQGNDWIFAGWFTDETCEKALGTDVTTGTYYAKFVPSHVLGIKAQISASLINNAISDSTTGDMRFITSVDSLTYSKIGIDVELPTGKVLQSTKNTVYDKLSAVGNTDKILSYKACEVFCSMSMYFKTYTVTGIPSSYFDKEFKVTPYWVTKDGTLVKGETVAKTVNQGIESDKVFVSGSTWDVSKQNEGIVSQTGGGNQMVDFYHKYDTMDLTVTLKNDSGKKRRVGIVFEFDNGKKIQFTLLNNGAADTTDKYIIQTMDNGTNNNLVNAWSPLYTMSTDEINAFNSDDGIDFRIVKDKAKFYLYLNGAYVNPSTSLDFSSQLGDSTSAKVTLSDWTSNKDGLVVPFSVSTTIKNTFATGSTWNISEQLEGKVSQTGGGHQTVEFADTYDTMDLTLTLKNDTTQKSRRIGVIYEFSDGQKVGFTLLNNAWDGNPHYIIQTPELTGTVLVEKYKTIYNMSDAEKDMFNSDNGIKFRIVKDGAKFYLYLNNTLISNLVSLDFSDKIYDDTSAKVTLAHWGAQGENLTVPFSVSTKIPQVQGKTFLYGSSWDVSKQDEGQVTLTGGNHYSVEFAEKYDTMDLTLKVKNGKDYSDNTKNRRVGVIFEFANGKKICFCVFDNNWKKQAGQNNYMIQAFHQGNGDLISTSNDTTLYRMTADEIESYNGDGIDFRIVKDGAKFYLYLNGTYASPLKSLDFSDVIGENTSAKITLSHWGAAGEDITIPFSVSRPVSFTGLTEGNGIVTTDKDAYVVGDKVTLTVTPDTGYRCIGLEVNGKELTANDDGTYTFVARNGICNVVTTYG